MAASSTSAASPSSSSSPSISSIPHFLTGVYQKPKTFLEDAEYGRCLDIIVKACNDIMLIHADGRRIFLGKREMFPQKDWWYGCGGRMRAGESSNQCIHRLLKGEISVIIPVEELSKRMIYVGAYWYLWGKREQTPKENGTADISAVFAIPLIDSEIGSIVAKEFEYREWRSMEEIVAGDYHPALKRSVLDYIRIKKYSELNELILHGKRINLLPHWTIKTEDIEIIDNVDLNGNKIDISIKKQQQSLSSEEKDGEKTEYHGPITDSEIVQKTRDYFQFVAAISKADHRVISCYETV